MLGARIGWRKEGKEQINGLFVDRLEVDRCFETDKDAPHALEAIEPGMGHTHPVANAGRAELLTLEQGLQDLWCLKPKSPSGDVSHKRERLPLGRCVHLRDDRIHVQQIADLHQDTHSKT